MARASFRPGDPSQAAAPRSSSGGGSSNQLGIGGAVKAARASFRPGDPSQRAAPPEKKESVKKKSVTPGPEGEKSQVGKGQIEHTRELAPELQRAIAAELQIGLETIQNTVQIEILEVVEELQMQVQNLSKRFDKWKEQDLDGSGKDDKNGKSGDSASLKVEVHSVKDLTKSIQDDVSKLQKTLESYSEESKRVEGVVRKLEYRGDRATANVWKESSAPGTPTSAGSPGAKPLQGRILQSLQTDFKREMQRARKVEEKVNNLEQKMEEQGISVASKKSNEEQDATRASGGQLSRTVAGARAARKEDEEKIDKLDTEMQAVKKAITGLRKDLKTETEERIAKDEEINRAISELKGGDGSPSAKAAPKSPR